MSKVVTIEPCSRLEGHGKITLHLDDEGKLDDAKFHVVEFRGFEKLMEGRKVWEAPRITPRSCGICPVSHHLASAKACDDLFGAQIPESAKLIRELMHMGQFIHSHALHFFYLGAPDFFYPMDAAKRNILGVIGADPEMAKKAILLRKCGQEIIHITGGKRIHPITALPGGVSKPISSKEKELLDNYIKQAKELALELYPVAKQIFSDNKELINSFAPVKTNYMGSINNAGNLQLYDGKLNVISPEGKDIVTFTYDKYLENIGEKVATWSYMKFPFVKKIGWPDGMYRVGPLARLNVASNISTSIANNELMEFRKFFNSERIVNGTLQYHWARLIELIHAIEKSEEILSNPELLSKNVRVKVTPKAGEGVGIIEAPRGTLIHHYKADDKGTITMCNLIVATVGNNGGINMSVKEAAKQYVNASRLEEPIMNMVEMAVRAYDPCLSCATHAIGKMPLNVSLFDKNNKLLDKKIKN
ncbi:MAG: Ni/Fe hydrogenase subunit alpha [Nanoarchaeota archaeon]